MALIAVFLISLSSLAFEVLLTRVFAINQWNHLSFMVIGIALLGFAAGGTWLSLLDAKGGRWEQRLSAEPSMAVIVVLYVFSTIFAFLSLNALPLDYFRLPLEPIQGIYLLLAFVILTLPFFFAGMWLAVAFAAFPAKTGSVYFASMAGSACGAALPALLLPLWEEGRLIVITALVPLVVIPPAIYRKPAAASEPAIVSRSHHRFIAAASVLILIAGGLLLRPGSRHWLSVEPSPYKSLSQALRLPDTHVTRTHQDIAARIDEIASPYIRFAPGLSLKYRGALPEQRAVFRDGDSRLVLYEDLNTETADFARYTLSYAGYHLVPAPAEVLIVQGDGGVAVACALASGAGSITLVEKNPVVAARLAAQYPLSVYAGNFREYLQRFDRQFDVIHVENWGTSLAGSAALDQHYDFTRDSFARYLAHLKTGGVLILSRNLQLPPSDSLRMWATAYQALADLGVDRPGAHLLMLRNWDTYTLIVFRSSPPAGSADISEFIEERNFDLVYSEPVQRHQVNRYAVYDQPFYHIEIMRLYQAFQTEQTDLLLKDYPLDIAVQSDNRPFPSRFIKWHRLPQLYQSTGSRLYYLLMSGEVVVAVVLAEAIAVSMLLLGLPALVIRKKYRPLTAGRFFYFLSVGAGFMFIELFFIKQFVLVFGHPTVSFTVAAAGMLIFSAIGGLLSQRLPAPALPASIVLLVVFLALTMVFCHGLLIRITDGSMMWKVAASLALLAPSAVMAGIPFAAGMRTLLQQPVNRTQAWTANGCASILASIVSVQVALTLGISFIMLAAIGFYIIALVCSYGNRGGLLLRLSR
ncbi:MAG: hypothetical protein AMJ54_06875 [Deltaproteobacteria bacterium SG8_13]|nr:MAG: hypothetical protein AMJ54_06875 [Deltaproteobacteria bacterium SG8_13]